MEVQFEINSLQKQYLSTSKIDRNWNIKYVQQINFGLAMF